MIALSEQTNIPLVETHAGKSTLEFDFKNNLGGTGILGTLAANKAIRDADLVIGIGTRYTDFTTSSKTAFDPTTKFININVSRMQTYKLDAFQVVGDAKATLAELAPLLKGYQTQFGNKIAAYKTEWLDERARLQTTKFNREAFTPEIKDQFDQATLNEYADRLQTEFTQTEALITINDNVAPDSIVVCSAGSLPGDLQRLWNPAVPDTYHLEYGYSCMGYEINGALGAKMAAAKNKKYTPSLATAASACHTQNY